MTLVEELREISEKFRNRSRELLIKTFTESIQEEMKEAANKGTTQIGLKFKYFPIIKDIRKYCKENKLRLKSLYSHGIAHSYSISWKE